MLRDVLRWARITKSGSDQEQFHTQQMSYLGKTADGLMVFPYGVHGNLPPDSLALMFAVQCNPENRAAIGWTPKNRPQMAEGEVTFYHPPTNSIIAWREGGNLEITTDANVDLTCNEATINASGSVEINTPTWTLNGNMIVNGTMTNNGKDVGDTHKHDQANDSGGNTEVQINGVV
jgi:hypothetical protein